MCSMDERAVCSLAALKLAGRLPINVKGREVLIVYYKEHIYAVDRQCYRMLFKLYIYII